MRQTSFVFMLAIGLVLGCAEASAPLPAAEEVLLLVHRTTGSVSLIHVNTPAVVTGIPLGGTAPNPTSISAMGGFAVVPMGDDDAVAVVNLRTVTVDRTIQLASNSGATGAAMVDDSIAYVANPNLNTVTRVNYLTGDTSSVGVGRTPRAVVFTRGKVFVVNGNLNGSGDPLGPSWVSVVDPETNHLATGIDSIPLPGPGNAISADVAPDGVIYIMNAGDGVSDSRLSLVDPVGRQELGNFKGFGTSAGPIADNGGGRLYLSSTSQGLMVFDLIKRQVLRGAGNGITISENSGVSVDGDGRIYALEGGDCAGANGKLHILRRTFSEIRTVDVSPCPVAALVTEIPPQ